MKAEIATKKGERNCEQVFIFCSVWQLSLLVSCPQWHIDGTFKMAPKGFEQLVLIVVTNPQTNLHTPVLSAFLTSKTKEVYQLLFSSIKSLLDKYAFNIDFSKITIYCDFEQALRTTIRTECRGVSIIGCFFHYVKALWHKAAKLGLKRDNYLQTTKNVILQLKLHAHLSKPLKLIYWDLILKSLPF